MITSKNGESHQKAREVHMRKLVTIISESCSMNMMYASAFWIQVQSVMGIRLLFPNVTIHPWQQLIHLSLPPTTSSVRPVQLSGDLVCPPAASLPLFAGDLLRRRSARTALLATSLLLLPPSSEIHVSLPPVTIVAALLP